jgi:hypothetical protein
MRARLLILLWLLGIEVMPGLHQEFHHAGDHHHDGDQIVADDDHHEADDHQDADRPVPQTELDHPEHAHAGGGLAHRATALRAASPPITKPLRIDRVATDLVASLAQPLISTFALVSCARGPPVTVMSRSTSPRHG